MKKKEVSIRSTDAEIVKAYMDKLEHPLKNEIEELREIIKNSNNKIAERIKWNAPSYYYKKEDFVTFHVKTKENVHLIFHHAAIAKVKSSLLQGDYKDRRMVHFNDAEEVQINKKELEQIIHDLIKFMDIR